SSAGDVDLRRRNERIVLTERRQIVGLVLQRDLLELPVAAIDAGGHRELALPYVGVAGLASRADPRDLRRTAKNSADEVDARFVVLRFDKDRVLLAALNRSLIDPD